MQVLEGLAAKELSADLMPRNSLAFDQRDAASSAGQRNSCGTACHSTTDDKNFVFQSTPIQIGRSDLNLDSMEEHGLRRKPRPKGHRTSLFTRSCNTHQPLQHKHYRCRTHIPETMQHLAR